MKKIVVKDEICVIDQLVAEIENCYKRASNASNAFHVGLSGGSVLNFLKTAIPRLSPAVDLTKWKLYFCDERYVDESDPDSTFGCYKKALISSTLLKLEQFVPIDLSLPLEDCARDYERKIRENFGLSNTDDVPSFDLLLLGMGPDGHTCSLFPGHDLVKERKRLIAPIADSPKPPPKRITMTLPLINKAKCCIFAMSGHGKTDIVKRIFVDGENLPAGMVAPENGELIGIFDEGAGKYISIGNSK